jgi:hypothetical protein
MDEILAFNATASLANSRDIQPPFFADLRFKSFGKRYLSIRARFPAAAAEAKA